MQTLKLVTACVLFSLSYFYSHAQEKIPINQPDYNKARLFQEVPQKINLKVSDMESLFDFSVGTSVTAKFSKDFYLQGTIVSKSNDHSVKAVIMKATNKQGAVFTFTKITKQDGSSIYKGRILSKNNSDAFEIVKENDQYILQKKNYYEIVSE
jgi:hypothetical protein